MLTENTRRTDNGSTYNSLNNDCICLYNLDHNKTRQIYWEKIMETFVFVVGAFFVGVAVLIGISWIMRDLSIAWRDFQNR